MTESSPTAPRTRVWARATLALTLLLAGYIGYLLVETYHAQAERQDQARVTYERETLSLASILGHAIRDAEAQLDDLARSSMVRVYFANRDRGMTLEYGLRANLIDIG
ncbi:hypothetical protein GF314_01810, partial [bacterium]|nr:hypothetical protein [bacterium]